MHDDAYWNKRDIKKLTALIIAVVLGMPKTLFFNLKYFGIKGLCFPVILSNKVKLKKIKGSVLLPNKLRFGMIKIGFPAAEMFDNNRLSTIWINDGMIRFEGTAGIHNGTCIRNYGELIIGNQFHTSSTAMIICYKKIRFQDNVLLGWDVEVIDGDAHKIFAIGTDTRLNTDKEICIGSNVWVGSHSTILKGVSIPDDCVIAAGSMLLKSITCSNSIVGGYPTRILKNDIEWKV